MLPAQVQDALRTLTAALGQSSGTRSALHARWRGVGGSGLSPPLHAAADVLDRALPTLTRSTNGVLELSQLYDDPQGEIVFTWLEASAARDGAKIARLLTAASTHKDF